MTMSHSSSLNTLIQYPSFISISSFIMLADCTYLFNILLNHNVLHLCLIDDRGWLIISPTVRLKLLLTYFTFLLNVDLCSYNSLFVTRHMVLLSCVSDTVTAEWFYYIITTLHGGNVRTVAGSISGLDPVLLNFLLFYVLYDFFNWNCQQKNCNFSLKSF